jgi:hypothetical protein
MHFTIPRQHARVLSTTMAACAALLGIGFVASVATEHTAAAQTAAASSAPAAVAALQTYELPNRTASIRIPPNFRVTATGVGFIEAIGPEGEIALFGVMVPAQNSPTTSLTPGGVLQPYTADAREKFLEAINWVRQHNGKPSVQARFVSSEAITAPAAFGQCSNMKAFLASNGRELAVETDFCALPMDSAGNYHDFFKAVGLPATLVQRERSLMEAILASYRLNLAAVRSTRSAANAAPVQAAQPQRWAASPSLSSIVSAQNSLLAGNLMMEQARAINAQTMRGMIGSNRSVDNFDHGILRGDTPIYAEGQSNPVFWVGH